jgi:hypothetical protein
MVFFVLIFKLQSGIVLDEGILGSNVDVENSPVDSVIVSTICNLYSHVDLCNFGVGLVL